MKEVYYPLSKIDEKHRDIALVELENAHNLSSNQSKIYTHFANILIGLATLILTISLNSEKFNLNNYLTENNLFIFTVFIFFVGIIILRYFSDLQKEITINARKVVTLRSMLGLDYSSVQLTLPKERIEGATNPFKIKFFNGWRKFQSAPVFILIILVSLFWTFLFYEIDLKNFSTNKFFFIDSINLIWFTGIILISTIYLYVYRTSLYDRHEKNVLHFIKLFAWLFNIRLFKDFEYSIYRAKLSYIELDRNKINYENLKKIIIKIEDERFYNHKGINFKALIRASASQFSFLRKRFNLINSGGSTIEMQLARTIFIPTNQNKYKRKFLEFFFAYWFNQVLTKDEILNIYVASVRYGPNIMGLKSALHKYFYVKSLKTPISNEIAFILTERLSNISGNIDQKRISFLMNKVNNIDKEKIISLYSKYINFR